MKYFLLFFSCLALAMSGWSQTKFKHLTLSKVEKLDYIVQDLEDAGCLAPNEGEGIVLIELVGVDPESSDEKKQAFIQKLDQQLVALKAYAECTNVHTIVLKLAEATFLQEGDGFELYSKAYFRKGYKLNAERFKQRYIDQFNLWFSDKKIILTDWNW